MTHVEQILSHLADARDGLTAKHLQERLDIPKSSLATLIWELKRDGHIVRVGGTRGRYLYGITASGRRLLPRERQDPLSRLAYAVGDDRETLARFDFQEIIKTLDRIDEVRLLEGFCEKVYHESPELLANDREESYTLLRQAALAYLGIDASALQEQRQALEALLKLVRR